MKTKTVIAAILLAITGVSCKKQYSCECKSTYAISGSAKTDTQINTYSEKMKESQARAACRDTETKLTKVNNDYAADVTYFSGENTAVTTECSIK